MSSRSDIEAVATAIVDAALHVHRELGPGLLESAYQASLIHALRKRGHSVDSEVSLAIVYDGVSLDAGGRVDMIVDRLVLVENKTVRSLAPIHFAQVLTYLKMSGLKLGLLINWNPVLIKNGTKRVVNGLEEPI